MEEVMKNGPLNAKLMDLTFYSAEDSLFNEHIVITI